MRFLTLFALLLAQSAIAQPAVKNLEMYWIDEKAAPRR